jgi:multimeric flavodoxin WrbA
MKILSICGSPRRGNSETILLELQKLFKAKGVENEIVLLREKNINRCHGCIEFCNPNGICCQKDDVSSIIDKMVESDALIIISPNYFQMPPGLLKDFMDRSCVIFANGKDKILKKKKTAIITVGAEKAEESEVCAQNIAKFYCRYVGKVVATKSFQTKSELKGNYNDIFENNLNPNIRSSLGSIVEALLK